MELIVEILKEHFESPESGLDDLWFRAQSGWASADRAVLRAFVELDPKTIVFSASQAKVLAPMILCQDWHVDFATYRLPFLVTFLQFTQPLAEAEVLEIQHADMPNDLITGVALIDSNSLEGWRDQGPDFHAILLFATGALLRVAWDKQGNLRYAEGPRSDLIIRNIKRTQAFAGLLVQYINCINFELIEVMPPEAVNKKRAKRGKRLLKPYYAISIKPQYAARGDGAHGTGSKHGHIYDVRGHFRRLQDGRTIWVQAHQRGLSNEVYIPGLRKIK